MADNKAGRNHSDELYTVALHEQAEKGEKIPERIMLNKRNLTDKNPGDNNKKDADEDRKQVITKLISKIQEKYDYYDRHGKPPVLTTAALLAKSPYYTPPAVQRPQNKKSYIELAREYAGRTHEATEHIPFMCYWPSYSYMSEAQLNWYFYMRSRIRSGDYISTDLSYIFVYIYELINRIGTDNPDDGLEKLINVWINYRKTYSKLDGYLTEWTDDYINFYKCDAGRAFELLKKEGLFLLMPTDMLADYYLKNGLIMPIELIARFSDYKFYESIFIKGVNGNLFTDYLPGLVDKIRRSMNEKQEGSFEKRGNLVSGAYIKKKYPFQRATFHNPDNVRIETYPPYEQNKPFRLFITAVIKEFDNHLRILTRFRGRLHPDDLPDDIKDLCKAYARSAFDGTQPEQIAEIKIDREKLLALIQDSDEVRKRLIEGSYEYDGDMEPEDISVHLGQPLYKPENSINPADKDSSFKSGLTPIQQRILDFILLKGGSITSGEINAAFPGVFIGVEIDRINDYALESIGDLLIGLEDGRWYVMEDYINDI